jgi:hypothetical protein
VSFTDIIARNTAGDEEAGGMSRLLSLLEDAFDSGWFSARDVLSLLDGGGVYGEGDYSEKQERARNLRAAIEEAGSAVNSRIRPLPEHGATTTQVGRKLSILVDRVVEIEGRSIKLVCFVDAKHGNKYCIKETAPVSSPAHTDTPRAERVRQTLARFERHEDDILRDAVARFVASVGAQSVAEVNLTGDRLLPAEGLAEKLIRATNLIR